MSPANALAERPDHMPVLTGPGEKSRGGKRLLKLETIADEMLVVPKPFETTGPGT